MNDIVERLRVYANTEQRAASLISEAMEYIKQLELCNSSLYEELYILRHEKDTELEWYKTALEQISQTYNLKGKFE